MQRIFADYFTCSLKKPFNRGEHGERGVFLWRVFFSASSSVTFSEGSFYELSAKIRPTRVYPRPILFLYFCARTRVIVIQAKAMKTVLKMNSQRYWSPSVSTITPPNVGPNTAANCEEK